ncbi:MAG: MFS transporter, partial [Firmicutes bacterium]|nr:MFS transporter [Bacillota bacterium]
AMDQVGAALGPLILSVVLVRGGSYRQGFSILLVPALAAISFLLVARRLFPRPRGFETGSARIESGRPEGRFWIYLAAVAAIAAGYVDFPLIAYHLKRTAVTGDAAIPLLYALAMGIDAIAALVLGRLYDTAGVRVLVSSSLVSLLSAPLVFLGGVRSIGVGMVAWGIGMGAQESVLRAVVADMVPADRRGSAYGVFYCTYGLSWFLGSLVAGLLYDISLPGLAVVSMGLQALSIPLLLRAGRVPRSRGSEI